MSLLGKAQQLRFLCLDRVAPIPTALDFRETLIAPVATLDAVAVPVVPFHGGKAVGPLVPIFDRVAIRGSGYDLPHG